MKALQFSELLCLSAGIMAQGATNHPQVLLGPVYLPPQGLQSSEAFSSTLSRLSSQLKTTLANSSSLFGNFTGNANSVSVSIVSTSQENPLFTFQSTSKALNVSAGGTTNVTSNSIFRIGSISKLLTVYAFLLNDGFTFWDRPITDYVPELRNDAVSQGNFSQVDDVMWEKISLGSLASFMSGIGRDYNMGDLSTFDLPWTSLGLPQLAPGDVPSCAGNEDDQPCSRAEYLQGLPKRHPVFLPQSTPVYSNTAFRILSYAMEAIAGDNYENMVNKSIIQPLTLQFTSVRKPQDDSQGVIPQGDSYWDLDVGDEAPSGGIYSSASDLATIGRNILLSSQLPWNQTRRWLKPLSHTAALSFSVGAPWEIWRTMSNITTGRTIDLYTKGGSIGSYETNLILIPDYQVAVSIMTAGPDANVVNVLGEIILQSVIPALETAAKEESNSKMVGRYVSDGAESSSMVLKVDAGPGLVIESWISNGSDLLKTANTYASQTNGGEITAVRLYPTDLVENKPNGRRVEYRAVFESAPTAKTVPRVFDQSLTEWQRIDQTMYGNVGVDDFVFDFDVHGAAIAVEPRVLKVSLKKQSSEPFAVLSNRWMPALGCGII